MPVQHVPAVPNQHQVQQEEGSWNWRQKHHITLRKEHTQRHTYGTCQEDTEEACFQAKAVKIEGKKM